MGTRKVWVVTPPPKVSSPFVAVKSVPATAVRLLTAKPTVTVPVKPLVRMTVITALVAFSSTAKVSEIKDSTPGLNSLSTMVSTALEMAPIRAPPVGLARVRFTVRSPAAPVSWRMVMGTFRLAWPFAKASVRLAGW